MTGREGEYGWEAIPRAIGIETPRRDMAAKIAAAWVYHQFKLHASDNRLNPHAQDQLNSAISILSDEERAVLDEAHSSLAPHNYSGFKKRVGRGGKR